MRVLRLRSTASAAALTLCTTAALHAQQAPRAVAPMVPQAPVVDGCLVVYNDSWHCGTFAKTGIPAGPRQRQLIVKYTKLFDFTR